MDGQIDGYIDKNEYIETQTDKLTHTYTHTHTDRHTHRGIQMNEWTGRQKD